MRNTNDTKTEKENVTTSSLKNEENKKTENNVTNPTEGKPAKQQSAPNITTTLLLKYPKACLLLAELLKENDEEIAVKTAYPEWQKPHPATELKNEDISEETKAKILTLYNAIRTSSESEINTETAELLRKALEYDEDISTATQQGYINGKNEKIDLAKMPHISQETQKSTNQTLNFPIYAKKSIWE